MFATSQALGACFALVPDYSMLTMLCTPVPDGKCVAKPCSNGSFMYSSTARLVDSPPLQHLIGLVSRTPSSASRTSQLVSSLTHSMAALSMADLALHIPGRGSNRNRHSTTETAHSADARARLLGDASFDSEGKWTELCSAAKSRYQAATSGLQQVVVEPLQHAGFIAVRKIRMCSRATI